MKEQIDVPQFCSEGLLSELLETKPLNVGLEVPAVDEIEQFLLVELTHCSINPPGTGIRV